MKNKDEIESNGVMNIKILECRHCGQPIPGSSYKQAKRRLEVHQTSKKCLRMRK